MPPSTRSDAPVPAAACVDACLRVGAPVRVAPAGLRAVVPDARIQGRALAVRHHGSVDVFFEAFETAQPGDILVIDNAGRLDEGCIGDLTVLESTTAKIAGLVVWGAHRDTEELRRMGVPVFSYGHVPAGPVRARERPADAMGHARFGDFTVRSGDLVVADSDGAAFVDAADAEKVLRVAREIAQRERTQAETIRAGTSLREQLRFRAYLQARERDPHLTFREHLRRLRGEIEQ